MDYSRYASQYQPITLPSDNKPSLEEPLLHIPIPTVKLDNKRAITPKIQEEPTQYNIFWTQRTINNTTSIKDAYKMFVDKAEGQRLAKVAGDRGGLTNNGITLNTWKAYGSDKNGDGKIDEKDLALMTKEDHSNILETRFWNAARADEINNPYLAAYVVDWMWGSGPGAFRQMHKALGLKPQAKMTQELLDTLNSDPENSYNLLHNARRQFYKDIVAKDASQAKFLKGWLRRADAISLNGFTI